MIEVMNIVVLNDTNDSLGDLLSSKGISSRSLDEKSPDQVVKAIHKEQPDLILINVGMTGKYGIEVCRKLKQNSKTRSIPVVFISRDDQKGQTEAFVYGCIDYICLSEQEDLNWIDKLKSYTQLGKVEKAIHSMIKRMDSPNMLRA